MGAVVRNTLAASDNAKALIRLKNQSVPTLLAHASFTELCEARLAISVARLREEGLTRTTVVADATRPGGVSKSRIEVSADGLGSLRVALKGA